jgi:hypothetical protein
MLSLLNYHRISWLHEFVRFFKPGLVDRSYLAGLFGGLDSEEVMFIANEP